MTPLALLEKSMNPTSMEWSACAKDSDAESDSLLWHCSREHLSTLSRAELEGRLESTFIIEALSCQLRDWQQSDEWPVPRLGSALVTLIDPGCWRLFSYPTGDSKPTPPSLLPLPIFFLQNIMLSPTVILEKNAYAAQQVHIVKPTFTSRGQDFTGA
ncbi:hypothetical protein UY3_07444 [Chelonia mydas]|uniref:Uncharacterized protein n=1 Tax=Chelonia mydas TaxID=8469 RepID=M7BIJ5_CHEMY|nr:hypothetical protein UY3_07444 [Chelonia mydas]